MWGVICFRHTFTTVGVVENTVVVVVDESQVGRTGFDFGVR